MQVTFSLCADLHVGRQHSAPRSSYSDNIQLDRGSLGARVLLQAEQQAQIAQQAATQATQTLPQTHAASANDNTLAEGIFSAAEARPEAASQAQARQPMIQQYQPSNKPFLDTDRLISAAAAQASQLMSDSVQTHEGDNQFDAWPLVNPPFQEALHEVHSARYCRSQQLIGSQMSSEY